MTLPSLPILPLFSLFFQFSLFFPVLYYPSKYIFPIFLTFRVNMTNTYRCSLESNRIFLRQGGIVSIAVKIQHEHSNFFVLYLFFHSFHFDLGYSFLLYQQSVSYLPFSPEPPVLHLQFRNKEKVSQGHQPNMA